MGTWDKWKPSNVPKEWTPTSKEVECKFCKLAWVFVKDHMVAHLGGGVTLCQYQGSIFKAIFTRCGGVWPAFEGWSSRWLCWGGGDHVVGSYQRASYNTVQCKWKSNCFIAPCTVNGKAGGVQTYSLTPHTFPMSMNLKGGMQNSTNAYIPISIDCHSAFFEVVKATNEAKIWYEPPAYHIMRKNLLNNAR